MSRYDAIVVGLGAHGSATAYQLARRGLKVAGFDRFKPPHDQGSSHGESRIIREAYHENPVYVPLVQRAYELWAELERTTGRRIFRATGGLMMGPRDAPTVMGAQRSAQEYALPHEMLDASAIRRRFPGYAPDPGTVALLEPRAGALFLPDAVQAHLDEARRYGAELHEEEPVLGWSSDGEMANVSTERGRYFADHLIFTAGPWLPRLVGGLKLPLVVERQVMYWFKPKQNAAWFAPDRFPVFIWDIAQGKSIYGFPDLGTGMKIGIHHWGETVDPDRVRRTVDEAEVQEMRGIVRRCFPDADGPPAQSTVCLYTNTPDLAFILDHHPRFANVVIGSPCSGHGFKFASSVGEVLADLAVEGKSRFDLSLFSISRFKTSPATRRPASSPRGGSKAPAG